MGQLIFLLKAIKLVSLSFWFRLRAGVKLPGLEFDRFGRRIAWSFFTLRDWGRFLSLLTNPVSITRYFEFPFTLNAVSWEKVKNHLDISSPRLFFLYLLDQYPHLKIEILNPDLRDLEETKLYLQTLLPERNANLVSHDATQLPYPDNHFDVITSISTIEHISDNGDTLAVRELWRVLKPGGKLILTLPCKKKYDEEWRDTDTYKLGSVEKGGKYFFQRFYDTRALQERIFKPLDTTLLSLEVFGENKAGSFDEYIQRWLAFGIDETIKDPYYIARDYRFFESIEMLIDVGVCGLILQK
ncbi:methyltransferase domain-containing protein [Lusitaniella coriacea]|uniref:methyltransferase domain-containing protein n=1 Tax=Lusitaniella coriacea TaxID=1983105 RepID=UPI003CEC5B93